MATIRKPQNPVVPQTPAPAPAPAPVPARVGTPFTPAGKLQTARDVTPAPAPSLQTVHIAPAPAPAPAPEKKYAAAQVTSVNHAALSDLSVYVVDGDGQTVAYFPLDYQQFKSGSWGYRIFSKTRVDGLKYTVDFRMVRVGSIREQYE